MVCVTEVATGWARDQLEVVELTLLRDRPWSSVWSVNTRAGRWWLKENRAGTTYETRLLALLTGSGTDLVPSVRVHAARPWALVADAGTSLRRLAEQAAPDDLLDFWCGLLPRYGELQRQLPAADLRAAGVPDLTADRLLRAPLFTRAARKGEEGPQLSADRSRALTANGEKLLANLAERRHVPLWRVLVALCRPFRDNGYATEAAFRLFDLAFDNGARAVLAHSLPWPNPSTAVMQKLGMKQTAEVIASKGKVWQWEVHRDAHPNVAERLVNP